jgi:hypothetical protein
MDRPSSLARRADGSEYEGSLGSAALGSGRIYREKYIEKRSEASGATLDAESP